MIEELLAKVKNNEFMLGVLGLGRVGLPFAVTFAHHGIKVLGADIKKNYVGELLSGKAPFKDVHLEDFLKETVSNKNFIPTTDTSMVIKKSDIIVITVGTPINNLLQPDYLQLTSVLDEIAKHDIRNKLIIMRSTSSPGTLEGLVKSTLEKKTKFVEGEHFLLAACPERIVEGKATVELYEIPEMVGCIQEGAGKIVEALFKKLDDNKEVIHVKPKEAELAKLFTNVYRYVNFALANEFAMIAHEYGLDAHKVIDTANFKYKRGPIPKPGLVGGPCLTKDGYYMSHGMTHSDFILMAWKVNEYLPYHIVNQMKKEMTNLNLDANKSKIGVLGLTFKSGSDNLTHSPSKKIVDIIGAFNDQVKVHDPYVPGTNGLEETINTSDAVILAMNHPEFQGLEDKIEKSDCKLLVDCWGMLDSSKFKKVKYIGFGRVW